MHAAPSSPPRPEAGPTAPPARAPRSAALAVFFSATIGYSLYYVCRLSLSVVKSPLVAEGLLSEFQLGLIGSALFYTYAVGKLVNGFLADRVDIRRFAAAGLLVSALINLFLGFSAGFLLFFTLWLVNGWVQSMGPGSFVVGLTRWFSVKERGTYYGLWSASHNIGEGLTFVFTAIVVSHWGWRCGWWASAILGLAGVAVIWLFFRSRPPGCEEAAPAPAQPGVQQTAGGNPQWRLLKSPAVWVIALASMFMYVSRYSVNSWGIFFLENAKGYAVEQASLVISVGSLCGVLGTVASGCLSDKLFLGDRAVPAILAGTLNALAIGLFLAVPPGWIVLDVVSMALFGVSIGALVCYLGGLMAVDLAGKGAAGAALGIVGVASYAGAGTQDIISGFLIGTNKLTGAAGAGYDFFPLSVFWVASALLSVVMSILAWRISRKSSSQPV